MKKCPVCNNEVKEEDAIYNTKTKRYYHENCYQILLDRKQLCDYICEIYKYKSPTPKMYQQMTAYYERGISYSDMLLSLKYFYEIEKGDITKSQQGIGIIPYVIDRAKQYATLTELEQKKLIEKFENKIIDLSPKQIIIKEKEKRNNRKNIDINSL
jgi:hypothetical protein